MLPSSRAATKAFVASMASNGENAMTMLIKTLAAVAAATVLAMSVFAQSAREVRAAWRRSSPSRTSPHPS